MTLQEAIDARHSVRAYKTDLIPEEIRERLHKSEVFKKLMEANKERMAVINKKEE